MKNINAKLFELRKYMGKIVRSKDNPFTKSKYADINSVLEATEPALEAVGLLFTDTIQGHTLHSVLTDTESGEFIKSETPLILVKNDMQAYASALTYARRFARVTMLSLQQTDDDGANASGQSFIKPRQIKQITELALETNTDMQKFLSHYRVSMIKDMWESTAQDAIKTLTLKKEKGVQNGAN